MNSGSLHMIRADFDRRGLFRLARARRLPAREVDVGYLLHASLRGLFGDGAPAPFAWREHRVGLAVLGYASKDAEELADYARAFADPDLWAVCKVDDLASKMMPRPFRAGQRLGFEVRVCPTVRKSASGAQHRKGAEVDVFLSRSWERSGSRDLVREKVYREWLANRIESNGAARLSNCRMTAFRLARLTRSTHSKGPRVRVIDRPDAQFDGTLVVEDPGSFSALLERGVGRHRAFGFGMLLLRPPAGG